MKKSVLSSASIVLFGAAVAAVLVFATGCEWESSGSEGSWDDSMSWVNFSGVYRSDNNARTIVSDFSQSVGDGGSDAIEYSFANQPGIIQPEPFTVFSGTINYINRGVSGWSLKPGSVTINMIGTLDGPMGSFADGGGGGLSGTYSQAPGSQSLNGNGSIDYDTGAWGLTLEQPFIEDAQISYSYVVLHNPSGSAGSGGSTPSAGIGDTLAIAGGSISSILVEQTGNRLTFHLGNGAQLDGKMSTVTVAGGDRTGRTAGDVAAVYEVSGVSGGQKVKLTGSFAGAYSPPGTADEGGGGGVGLSGRLWNRQIQGVWMQPDGTADVYGIASQISVDVTTTPDPFN